MTRNFSLTALLAIALLASPAGARASRQVSSSQRTFVERPGVREFSGQLIVKPLASAQRIALGALDDYEVVNYIPRLDLYVLRIPAGRGENSMARELEALGGFEFVEPNWRVFPLATPNDGDDGNGHFEQQWHHDVMDSRLGWDLHTGNPSAVVTVVDSGIRANHAEFQLHRLPAYNLVTQKWEGEPGAVINFGSHGTQVTGCAAANGNNGVGVCGVGWDLGHRMVAYRNGQLDLNIELDVILSGILFVVEETGDRIVSVSLGGVGSQSTRTLAQTLRNDFDALLIWAAGNHAPTLDWGDRDADDLIVVGGTNDADMSWVDSGIGSAVDLVAPAVNVTTTTVGGYITTTGTSFATPLVAGLCALIASYDPSLTADEIESILKNGAEDLGSLDVDDVFGYGRINVYNSLKLAAPVLGAAGCPTTPNSVGGGAVTVVFGSSTVSDNELVLSASGLPVGVSAKFLIGTEAVNQPSGDGYLCAGGTRVTLHPNLTADEHGRVQRIVDLSATPASNVISPGASTVIQLWYRDPNGGPAGFNLSNSIEIDWQ